MLLIAHRGCSKVYPENTIEAFKHAIKQGITCIELDVCITKDNVIIIDHNTFSKKNSVHHYDISYNENKDLSLSKVFRSLPNNITYFIDIKDNRLESNIVKHVVITMLEHDANCILSSFSEKHLDDMLIMEQDFNINISKAYITGNYDLDMFSFKMNRYNLSYLILYKFQINKETVDYTHVKNVKVIAYTCNTQGLYDYMENMNIDGIMSDNPEIFVF
ncbi:putative glycerophosphodiester phosphodiesterase [Heterosigma akashiwo virus 01]|uniref:Putative glycerophosphodiester phosphodiesterase n=1 Tax=Heterosigma akashiwo virus 01 TaxID=97195 RepID=A0A1C9C589_HAV01|nr:putative glycerophosphodiester phosphodiesterase [Heterosigma akashiwo virus 01]AOM63450.1 putative glycerophosphodiester phosphodiesterase [Heterosigma akashiwo virus 01]